MVGRRSAAARAIRAARALLIAGLVLGSAACREAGRSRQPADSVRVAAPVPSAPSGADSGGPAVSVEGPWASEAWRVWRDTAPSGALIDTALADLAAPRGEWPAAATFEFVSEALALRAASDTTVAPALLAVLADSLRADSVAMHEAYQRAVSAVFEAHPERFADAYVGLPPDARALVESALLDGWLHRALDGRAPLDPPSARLAALPNSVAAHRLQARLAVREASYLKALRDALEGRRGVVT